MTKKPFFRAFDGCWYAQTRLGGKRKQVKLLDTSSDPIRGRENEEAALRAFQLADFAPAQREGRPVRSRIVIKVRFAPPSRDGDDH